MAPSVRLVTPRLFGRDDLLALGGRRLAAAATGHGGLLFLAGEAGIGKSRLLRAIEDRASIGGFAVVRGVTYPRDLEVGAAIFLDLAGSLGRRPELADVGDRISGWLASPDADGADANQRRRRLTVDIANALLSLGDRGPTLVALEDLHWADDLSLEILAAAAHGLANVPMLIVASYRSDELYPRIPMHTWRARLLNGRLAEEARLARLSPADTAAMTAALLGGELPPPRDLVEAVHDRSDGIPLHVEEIVAAIGLQDPARTGGSDARDVPETIDAAILDRFGQVSRRAREVAQAGAVIGRAFTIELLSAVMDKDPDGLVRALGELGDRFLVNHSPSTYRYTFKHALICDVVYRHTPDATRRRLHARVADVAGAAHAELSDAELSQHLEEAGRTADAHRAALAGARAAAAVSSHHEAYALYRRAWRNMPPGLPLVERARLSHELGSAAATADDQASAAVSLEEAHRLYLEARLRVDAAEVLGPLVAARHLLGDDLEARVARLEVGLALLDEAATDTRPAQGTAREIDRRRATLLASLSAAYMLDRRLEESMVHGERARELANGLGDRRTELEVLATIGSDMVFAGQMDAGWEKLVGATRGARDLGLEATAARAYRMLSTCASVLVEYERGETWLREGIAYAERVERWNDRHYMAGHLAHVLWATGRWADAERVARHALADGRGGVTTRVTALYVLGYVALGRGDWPQASDHLGEAREIGIRMRELQRLSPALWGLAEMAQLRGRHAEALELTNAGRAASDRVADAAYLFPFLVTGTRVRLALGDVAEARRWVTEVSVALRARSIPGTLPAIDHAQGLLALATGATGEARRALAAARTGWSALRRSWEGAAAGLDLAAAELRANRPAEAARLASDVRATTIALPSPPLARTADELLRTARARHPTDEPWAPLTSREWEVARLIAAGATNAEIARQLAISPRTVGTHVEHILGKLGAARRSEVAAWATRVARSGGGNDVPAALG